MPHRKPHERIADPTIENREFFAGKVNYDLDVDLIGPDGEHTRHQKKIALPWEVIQQVLFLAKKRIRQLEKNEK